MYTNNTQEKYALTGEKNACTRLCIAACKRFFLLLPFTSCLSRQRNYEHCEHRRNQNTTSRATQRLERIDVVDDGEDGNDEENADQDNHIPNKKIVNGFDHVQDVTSS